MKQIKFLLAIALVSVIAISCKETPKEEAAPAATEEVAPAAEPAPAATTDSTAVQAEQPAAPAEEAPKAE